MTLSSVRTSHRVRGIDLPTASHPNIRRVRRQGVHPAIHGNKLWKSGALLIDYLHHNRPLHNATVVDVGCGWGGAGIWCAKTLGSRVTSVDADSHVFPFLDVVSELNGVGTTARTGRFEQLSTSELSQFDMLIAADICFWDEMVNPVFNMINRAVKAGVKHIVIADPERPTFLQMAERCMNKHCAELIEWRCEGSIQARGAVLVIENA